MSSLKARTALAAQIARVNRQRLNEAIAEGFYPCAPDTVSGASRVFDVNDIVALRVYGHLLDEGVSPRFAGPMSCNLRDLLREHPAAERVVYVKDSFGSGMWLRLEDFDRDDEFAPSWSNARGDIVSFREWRLKFLRQRIVHELQEEVGGVGDE